MNHNHVMRGTSDEATQHSDGENECVWGQERLSVKMSIGCPCQIDRGVKKMGGKTMKG
uniref:Uncharacterized protein n=1 Tax=Octopus bimaculoides TaxID=37653 RepID=A0A0L8HW87_OCTBM